MKLIIPVLIFIISLWSCNNSSVRSSDEHAAIKDSDSRISHEHEADTGADRELVNISNEYVKRYKTPCTIDSVFAFGTDTFKIHLKHYCLMDSAIKVPKQYVQIYKLNSFVTHNFATEVRL